MPNNYQNLIVTVLLLVTYDDAFTDGASTVTRKVITVAATEATENTTCPVNVECFQQQARTYTKVLANDKDDAQHEIGKWNTTIIEVIEYELPTVEPPLLCWNLHCEDCGKQENNGRCFLRGFLQVGIKAGYLGVCLLILCVFVKYVWWKKADANSKPSHVDKEMLI